MKSITNITFITFAAIAALCIYNTAYVHAIAFIIVGIMITLLFLTLEKYA